MGIPLQTQRSHGCIPINIITDHLKVVIVLYFITILDIRVNILLRIQHITKYIKCIQDQGTFYAYILILT